MPDAGRAGGAGLLDWLSKCAIIIINDAGAYSVVHVVNDGDRVTTAHKRRQSLISNIRPNQTCVNYIDI